jgi:hypothetical protein
LGHKHLPRLLTRIARRQAELDKAVAAIDRTAIAIRGETSKLADLDRIYATIKQEAGRIDVDLSVRLSGAVGCLGGLPECDRDAGARHRASSVVKP